MRRRFAERKLYPDGLESTDAEGEAARGDPTSKRSWLSCHCIERDVERAKNPACCYLLTWSLKREKRRDAILEELCNQQLRFLE